MWLCLLMGKMLNYRKPDVWLKKIKEICGENVKYETVSNEVLTDNGDWYLFIQDNDWEKHLTDLKKCRFVVSVVSADNKPYLFSNSEVKKFMGGVKESREKGKDLTIGDIVLVLHGYLENLYGIVVGVRGKKAKVFFSFYVKSFVESLKISDLKKISRTDFQPGIGKHQIAMGAKVVFTNNIYR